MSGGGSVASGAGLKGTVVRVEPDDLVSAAEIARRVGRSRESIRQLGGGLRGPGGFPAPLARIKDRLRQALCGRRVVTWWRRAQRLSL